MVHNQRVTKRHKWHKYKLTQRAVKVEQIRVNEQKKKKKCATKECFKEGKNEKNGLSMKEMFAG